MSYTKLFKILLMISVLCGPLVAAPKHTLKKRAPIEFNIPDEADEPEDADEEEEQDETDEEADEEDNEEQEVAVGTNKYKFRLFFSRDGLGGSCVRSAWYTQ